MSSDTPKKSPPRTLGSPLGMIDALIGQPAAKPAKKPKGRSVLLAHALAQRENRLIAEKRAAASRLAEPEPKPAAPAQPVAASSAAMKPAGKPVARDKPAGKPVPERPSLDAMIVKALGASAHGHVHNGAWDRQGALADLIARTQSRLGTAGRAPAPASAPAAAAPAPAASVRAARGDREQMIAAAMRTHREQQQVFGELSDRQRATLRATAEAMVAKRAS
jgi:hypothetical protein